VHEIKPSVSPKVSMLVRKMMAVEANNRIQTMDDVQEAIINVRKKL
jgi:hypothetical protein